MRLFLTNQSALFQNGKIMLKFVEDIGAKLGYHSVAVWPVGFIIFQYLAISNNENLPNSMRNLPKLS